MRYQTIEGKPLTGSVTFINPDTGRTVAVVPIVNGRARINLPDLGPHVHNPGINHAGRYACLDCGTPTPALPRDAEWLPHPLDKEDQ